MARGVRAHRVAGDLNARSRTGVRWGARSDGADCGGARCSARIELKPVKSGTAPAMVQVWGGCGWGWHPVRGHWSQWRGGWVPPHCAPNRDGGGWGGPHGGWSPGPYRNWGAWQAPYWNAGPYGNSWAIRNRSATRGWTHP